MPGQHSNNLDYVRGQLLLRGSNYLKFAESIGKSDTAVRQVVAGTSKSAFISKALEDFLATPELGAE